MVPIATLVERNTSVDAPNIVLVPAATATVVLPPCLPRVQYAARYIQNVGANRVYYSFGVYNNADPAVPICDAASVFHGYLEAGQQLDCSAHASVVCCYSTAGTSISTTAVRRNTMGPRN